MSLEYELEGKKIVINECSFGKASKLKDAVAKLVVKGGLKLDTLFGENTVEEMIKGVLALDTDENCHNALIECLLDSTIDGNKIIKEQIVADDFIRKNYYRMIREVFEVNIVPFIEALASLLSVQ